MRGSLDLQTPPKGDRMRSSMKLIAVLLSLLVAACGHKGGEFVKAQEGFADRVCACSDVDCVKAVQKDQDDWVTKHGEASVGSEEDGAKVQAANKRLTDC